MAQIIDFDFQIAMDMVNRLTSCMDVLEAENQKLQSNFQAMHEDFKDAYYNEFEVEFNKGNEYIKKMNEIVRDLSVNILKHARDMAEL